MLPAAYQKFYYEWQETPTPVHYVPKAGRYVRNEQTGITQMVQNVPLPLKYPAEFDKCLMGGEAIVKGFYKSKSTVRRFPHFWIPTLKRTAVYSEILNQHMEVLATDRVIQLIQHHNGFDEYIMQVIEWLIWNLFHFRSVVRCFMTDNLCVDSIKYQIDVFRIILFTLLLLFVLDGSEWFENKTSTGNKTCNDQSHSCRHTRLGWRTRRAKINVSQVQEVWRSGMAFILFFPVFSIHLLITWWTMHNFEMPLCL